MSEADRPLVALTSGSVRGVVTSNGALAFLGIPYAKVRLPEGRFHRANPVEPWSGVWDAAEFGPASPQRRAEHRGGRGLQDEDCLVANVWTPGTDRLGLPVIVWIHGGAYSIGSASTPDADGAPAAVRNDVVMVSLNHRLDVFGHLHLGGVLGDEYADSPNAGIVDLIDGLWWVQREIASFGGDPDNVTIMGISGGGNKVVTLMSSPHAAGLFHRAVSLSGHELAREWDLDRADHVARSVLDELGIGSSPRDVLTVPTDDVLVAALRVSLREWRGLQTHYGGLLHFGLHVPVVDGDVLPRPLADSLAGGASAGIPLIIGSIQHDHFAPGIAPDSLPRESLDLSLPEPARTEWADRYGWLTRDELADILRPHLRDRTDDLVDAYRRIYPGCSPSGLLGFINDDVDWRVPAIRIADAHTVGGGRSYMYLWRASEVMAHELAFDTLDRFSLLKASSRHLLPQVNESWMSFARDGVPTSSMLPTWPAYSPDRRATMVFDDECTLVDDPQSAARVLWDDIL